jgi:phospholipid transport system transporter-binding protein
VADNLTESVGASGDSLQITGDLTIETLPQWIAAATGYVTENKQTAPQKVIVDFSQVDAIDSAAIALLLSWRRAAVKYNRDIQFTNLPENLIELAAVYGVSEILNPTPIH